MAAPKFTDVKTVLDDAVAGWKTKNGGDPDLTVHGANFGWDNKAQLAAAVAFHKRLIDPMLVGNGRAEETNLVKALRTGVSGMPRMPDDGPYLADEKIAVVVDWINGGMPD